MQSVFVINANLIASKDYFCNEFFLVIILAAMVGLGATPPHIQLSTRIAEFVKLFLWL